MLAASESIYYYDVDESAIRGLVGGVQPEETLLRKFVCSAAAERGPEKPGVPADRRFESRC
jgi:hypothetical protein